MAASLNSEFWRCIDELKTELQAMNRVESLCKTLNESVEKSVVKTEELSGDEVIKKLEEVILKIAQDISEEKSPSLQYNCRNSWKNTRYNSAVGIEMIDNITQTEHRFDSTASVGKFAATLKIIAFCYRLLQQDIYATKRDIYYSDVVFFGSQSIVDDIIDNLSCMIRVPRHSLHVVAASKGKSDQCLIWRKIGPQRVHILTSAQDSGCVAGDLCYREHDGTLVDCRDKASGTLVPSHVQGIYDINSDAKFLLIIEKEASFQRLLDDNILQKLHPCIVITGKGFPDVNTRMIVHRLWCTLQVPVLGLVDADPHGVEILSVYKFGSKALSFDSHNLTVPIIKWLGVLPSDIERLAIPRNKRIPLTERDRNKVRELLERPYIKLQKAWAQEIEAMLAMGYKAEIQALSSISLEFLSNTYLPVKIKHGKWI